MGLTVCKSIGDIKEQYQAASVNELPEFIACYESDERAGVKKLVASAEKQLQDLEKEKERIYKLQEFERKYGEYEFICGIDEVGRGPLAGPVVAAAVIMPEKFDIPGIDDSKKLSEKKREALYEIIIEKALAYGVGIVEASRIDEIGIGNAVREAFTMAADALSI